MTVERVYELVIGLEVHIQLNTLTKLFSQDSTEFGAKPNTQTSVISLAHPGSLPVLNGKAVEFAIRIGLACGSDISKIIYFDRKHYFYPDSPSGYQITQQNNPICVGGHVSIPIAGTEKQIELEKIHMEADAGKSIHDQDEKYSLVDLNRAGMPLLELVTKPVIRSADEAGAFITEIQKIVRFLDISDGNMEEGSLRCDANVSVKRREIKELGQKVEIKNMNSIRHVKKAIDYEYQRQSDILDRGNKVRAESRLFDIKTGRTKGMRGKEEAHDYRYFPEPDIAPLTVSDNQLNKIKETMPLLPVELRAMFIDKLNIKHCDAVILANYQEISKMCIGLFDMGVNTNSAVKWLLGPVKSHFNQLENADYDLDIQQLGALINLVENKQVTYKNAVELVLPELISNPELITNDIVKVKKLLVQSDEDQLAEIINKVLEAHPNEVQAYKNGKRALLQLFMGQVMKETKGKADPQTTMKLIRNKLD